MRFCCHDRAAAKPDTSPLAAAESGVPQGGVISPLLSDPYLNEVDKMLEKPIEVTRYYKWTVIDYARFADDLVLLASSHPKQRWLRGAMEQRLRQEFAKLQVEVNEDKMKQEVGFGTLL